MKLIIKTDDERSKLEAVKYVLILGMTFVVLQWAFLLFDSTVQTFGVWYTLHYPTKVEASNQAHQQVTAQTPDLTAENRPWCFDPLLCH